MKGLDKIKLDFLDVNLLLDHGLRDILKKFPHEIIDSFGNPISSLDPEKLDGGTYALSPHGVQDLVKLRTAKTSELFLPGIITDMLKDSIKLISERADMELREVVSADLESILAISENETLPFEKLLLHFLQIMRGHLLVEECSIFGISDGFTLEGIAGLAREDWKAQLLPVAGYVWQNKVIRNVIRALC